MLHRDPQPFGAPKSLCTQGRNACNNLVRRSHRPTRDLDLLGYGDPSAEAMSIVWKEICETVADDGITFDSEALRIAPIREELEYGGLRIRTTASPPDRRATNHNERHAVGAARVHRRAVRGESMAMVLAQITLHARQLAVIGRRNPQVPHVEEYDERGGLSNCLPCTVDVLNISQGKQS